MTKCRSRLLAGAAALGCAAALPAGAASHREAPVTAIDRTADITDWYAFVSPDAPGTVTMILAVDPLLEPANGPNYFPFDDNLLYEFNVDNDQDAEDDVSFEVRFTTEQRLPTVPVAFVGAGNGIPAPGNSPPPVAPGTPLIPPAITALDGAGSEGIGLRQTYQVTLFKNGVRTELQPQAGKKLIAVPSNVGPRTMSDYEGLFEQGAFQLSHGVKVFAGTTDDEFYIDLGAPFDSLNFRKVPGPGSTGIPAVLSRQQDKANANFVADDVSGYNVNTIALQVPISLLTKSGGQPPPDSPDATIGTYGATLRQQTERRDPLQSVKGEGDWVQVQRMGNPRIGGSNPPLGIVQISAFFKSLSAHRPVGFGPCRVPNAHIRDNVLSMGYNAWRQLRAARARQGTGVRRARASRCQHGVPHGRWVALGISWIRNCVVEVTSWLSPVAGAWLAVVDRSRRSASRQILAGAS